MSRRPAAHRSFAAVFFGALALVPAGLCARPRSPVPDAAYDSGVISAESRGRGQTIASNRGTGASGSENPASLDQPSDGYLYSTVLLATRSRLPKTTAIDADPLRGKTIQYLAVAAEKGVLFYEPMARFHQTEVLDATAGTSRETELNANALGFAGASKMKGGSFGLSIAYLWSDVDVIERTGSNITAVANDSADGLRMNLGFRYPTGPAMWGLLIKNAPAFLWGSEFRRTQLPLTVRVGNTYRLAKGVLLSVDGERRFYREGGKSEDFIYIGQESYLGKRLVVRAGAFGTSLNSAEDRTLTAGASIIARNKTEVAYAFESFELFGEKVKRSIISVSMPFVTGDE